MTNLELVGFIIIMLIVISGATLIYTALAIEAIIYAIKSNESPKGRRIFFGIMGVVMIIASIYVYVYLQKHGFPL